MGIAISTALYAVKTVSDLMGNSSKKKSQKEINAYNLRMSKLNNSIKTSNDITEQIKYFRDFSKEQAKLSSTQNVELYSGGISTKSSVFAGVKHEQEADYYASVQEMRENINKIEENKKMADLEAEMAYKSANKQANEQYNGFNSIVNNALSYYSHKQTLDENVDLEGKIGEMKDKISGLNSVFGVKSRLGGK